MYKVTRAFYYQKETEDMHYRPGDVFPRPGIEVSEEKIEEMLTGKNAIGKPVIIKFDEKLQKRIDHYQSLTVKELKTMLD